MRNASRSIRTARFSRKEASSSDASVMSGMIIRSRLLGSAAICALALSAGCENSADTWQPPPNALETFTTEDGRTAIGRRRIIPQPTIPGWTPASSIRTGNRWFVSSCDTAKMQLAPEALVAVVGADLSIRTAGECREMPVVVWSTTRLDEREDAVRIELLDGGAMGWLASGHFANSMDPSECIERYAETPERLSRCQFGPPVWTAPAMEGDSTMGEL